MTNIEVLLRSTLTDEMANCVDRTAVPQLAASLMRPCSRAEVAEAYKAVDDSYARVIAALAVAAADDNWEAGAELMRAFAERLAEVEAASM